jgi:hypothetical protein
MRRMVHNKCLTSFEAYLSRFGAQTWKMRGLFISLALVLLCATNAFAASRYWVGGTNTWDGTSTGKWSTTNGGSSGAAVPTASDDVFFTSNSKATGTVTISGTRVCKSLDCNGWAGTMAAGTSTPVLNIGTSTVGIIRLGGTWSYTGDLNLISTYATSAGNAVTFGGKTVDHIQFNGTGKWTLQDAALCTNAWTLTKGTLDTNNQTISTGSFVSSNTNTRTLTRGTTVVTITGTGTGWNCGDITNMTFTTRPSVVFAASCTIVQDEVNSYASGLYTVTINSGITLTLGSNMFFTAGILTMAASSVLTGPGHSVWFWASGNTPLVLNSSADLTGVDALMVWESYVNGITLPASQHYPSIYLENSGDNNTTLLGGDIKVNGHLHVYQNGSTAGFTLDMNGHSIETTDYVTVGSGSTEIGEIKNTGASANLTIGNWSALLIQATDHGYHNIFDCTNILLTVTGGLQNNDTFTHGSSTVTFGSEVTVSGTNTVALYNLTINPGTIVHFTSTETTTVAGTFTATGTSGSHITLNATAGGSQALLNITTVGTVSYVDATDINSNGGSAVSDTSGTLSNCLNWSVPGAGGATPGLLHSIGAGIGEGIHEGVN